MHGNDLKVVSPVDMPKQNTWIPQTGLPMQTNRSDATHRLIRYSAIGALALLLAACSGGGPGKGKYDPKYGVSASTRVATKAGQFKKGGGHYKVGKPYKVAGRTYVPKDDPGYVKTGKASWYGDDFHGRLTANGEIFDMHSLTAAHPTLPLPSYARVTNLKNGSSVIVRINDRGPYAHNRVIDLSKRVAEVLKFKNDGIANVKVKYIGRARMDGKDGRYLEASYRAKGQSIGDDFNAIPREGERFSAPEIMFASAKPEKASKPAASSDSYLMAHVEPLGGATTTAPVKLASAAPSPQQLASAPASGWAPVDLVGDGYFPPDGNEELQNALVQLAQIAPVQLNYAKASTDRVAAGYEAIESILSAPKQKSLTQALRSKANALQPENTQSTSAHTSPAAKPGKEAAVTGDIGIFEAQYALRIAEEYAALAAVDIIPQEDGKARLRIVTLKPGVMWDDIHATSQRLGLTNG